jgi:hypothetical protein
MDEQQKIVDIVLSPPEAKDVAKRIWADCG